MKSNGDLGRHYPRYDRIIAWQSAVGTPRPPLQRLLRRPRFARHRLHARPSTIPLGRLTLPHPTPGSNSQMDNSPPAAPPVVQYPAPGNDNRAAAEQLSNTLLSYNNRDWDQAQRADPLCDATRRYIKLGYPNPPLSPFATTCLHTRDLILRISSTSPLKVAYYREMMTPPGNGSSISKPSAVTSSHIGLLNLDSTNLIPDSTNNNE